MGAVLRIYFAVIAAAVLCLGSVLPVAGEADNTATAQPSIQNTNKPEDKDTQKWDFDSLLVVINGESNAGGRAPNWQAKKEEIGERPGVLILDNTKLESFETLNIGANNTIGHKDIKDCTRHGFELELANRAESVEFYKKPVYLVKTGQGSSTIAQWEADGEYTQIFTERVEAAKKLLGERKYRAVILFSLGINDAIKKTDKEAWKSEVIAHFGRMRKHLGEDTPIIITKFMPNFALYNDTIEEICRELPNTYCVDTEDATLVDRWHWDYRGMKLVTGRMLDILETLGGN